MALRDTEDKLRRCPKRVRPGWAGGERWLAGSGFPGQAAEEIGTALPLLLGAAPVGFLSLPPPPHRLCHIRESGAGIRVWHDLSPVTSHSPCQGASTPCPLSADAHPLSSSIMNSTLSAFSATCRVSRKWDLPPALPLSPSARSLQAPGSRAERACLGWASAAGPCPQLDAKPRLGQGESSSWSSGPSMVPGVSWPWAHGASAASHFHVLCR